jgi:hypothetical protein
MGSSSQVTGYVAYFYYKLNGWERSSLYWALDRSRTVSYIRKASPGIVPRPRSDYQVLARRRFVW